MLESVLPPITADTLMIPQSQVAWQASTQPLWGKLTHAAIILLVEKFKNKEITNLSTLMKCAAHCRQAIGTLLDHPDDIGKIRKGDFTGTPIYDHPNSSYRDQVPEFAAWYQRFAEVPDAKKITFTMNIDATLCSRTYVSKYADNRYHLQHTGVETMSAEILEAYRIFDTLMQDPNASTAQIRNGINRISFYLADAMPYSRGSASIVQMIYHALEKHFLGKFTYLGTPRSSHNHSRGLQFDIAAMLSPDFETFENYFTHNILEPERVVVDIDMTAQLDEDALVQKLALLKSQLSTFLIALKTKRSFVNDNRKVEKFIQVLSFIEKNVHYKPVAELYLSTFLTRIKEDKLFYPYFYTTLPHPQDLWMPPSLSDTICHTLEDNREAHLKDFEAVVRLIHDLWAEIGRLDTDNAPHWQAHYACKNLLHISFSFRGSHNSEEPIENIIPLFMKVQNKQFKLVVNEYSDLIDKCNAFKSTYPTDVQVALFLEEMVEKYNQSFPGEREEDALKILYKRLKAIYKVSETLPERIEQILPLWQAISPTVRPVYGSRRKCNILSAPLMLLKTRLRKKLKTANSDSDSDNDELKSPSRPSRGWCRCLRRFQKERI